MKANCNITVIEFEASSKRQKNDKRVSELLSDISLRKDGTYAIIKENLVAKKGTFANFEEVELFVNSKDALIEDYHAEEDTHTDAEYYNL